MDTFEKYFANGTITTATIGAGPNGELRYPAFPEDVWVFPGVGSFQVNDKYALKVLQEYANERNCGDWGKSGPRCGRSERFWPGLALFSRQWILEDGLRSIFSHVLPRAVDETRGTDVTKRTHRAIRERERDVVLGNAVRTRSGGTIASLDVLAECQKIPSIYRPFSRCLRRSYGHALPKQRARERPNRRTRRRPDCKRKHDQRASESGEIRVMSSIYMSRKHVEYTLETEAMDDFSDESFRRLYAHGMGVDAVCIFCC